MLYSDSSVVPYPMHWLCDQSDRHMEGDYPKSYGQPEEERYDPIFVVTMKNQASNPPSSEQQQEEQVDENAVFGVQMGEFVILWILLRASRCDLALLGIVGLIVVCNASFLFRYSMAVNLFSSMLSSMCDIIEKVLIWNDTFLSRSSCRVYNLFCSAFFSTSIVVQMLVGVFMRCMQCQIWANLMRRRRSMLLHCAQCLLKLGSRCWVEVRQLN